MDKAVVFTSSYNMVEVLDRHFDIRAIFCENEQYNLMLFNYSKWRSIPLFLVNKEMEITEKIPEDVKVGISFGFGLIFKEKTFSRFQKGIWNIHTGVLPEYRGRHPITWAFLRGDNKIGVTIHQVDTDIDRGAMIAVDYIYREMNDDLNEIDNKIISLVKDGLIKHAIENYNRGDTKRIKKGNYLKPFYSGISIESASDIDGDYLFNAIRAQRTFGGVKIGGKPYNDAYYYDKKFSSSVEEAEIVECRDGVKLALFQLKTLI
jgi:methionyl-tRNA formyltransferase